jgi:hypothetical protein
LSTTQQSSAKAKRAIFGGNVQNPTEAITIHTRGKQRVEETITALVPDDIIRIEYQPWRATQAQYRYRGVPNEYNLGEIE